MPWTPGASRCGRAEWVEDMTARAACQGEALDAHRLAKPDTDDCVSGSFVGWVARGGRAGAMREPDMHCQRADWPAVEPSCLAAEWSHRGDEWS
jgi:hypothetical protein